MACTRRRTLGLACQALRFAEELARAHDAILIPVLAWVPPGGDLADRPTGGNWIFQMREFLGSPSLLSAGCHRG